MTDIKCYVEDCIFNDDGYCSEGDITIGETGECWTAELKDNFDMLDDIEKEEAMALYRESEGNENADD